MNKVILIGIDGGTFDVIKPLIENNQLKTFRKMIYKGAHGILKTTIPCLSIPAIPSLFTGMNPGKLGIFGFSKNEGSSITYNDIMEDCVWDILADNGIKCCVVDVTGTYPPIIKNGIMISGSAPSEHSEYVYPRKWKSKVSGFYSEFDLLKKLESNTQKNMSEILNLAVKSERRKWKIFKDLMESEDYGLGVFWIVVSDDVQHYYWGFEDAILKLYKEIDNILKETIETFENCNVFVVSDHGFERRATYYFNINSWLRDKGYLRMKGTKLKQWFVYRISTIFRYLWRSFLTEKIKKHVLNQLKLMSSIRTYDEKLTSRNYFLLGVDWKNTVMYSDSSFGVRINARDRELYDRLRSKVIAELKDLKDSAGNPIMRGVWKREEFFWGKYAEEAPDIIFLTTEDYRANVFLSEKMFSNVEAKRKKRFRGDHWNARDGILVAYGPDIKKGYKVGDVSILDIAPTILYMLGCTISKEMDGKVIKEILTIENEFAEKEIQIQRREKKTVRSGRKISPEEKNKIRERLKALGYLD